MRRALKPQSRVVDSWSLSDLGSFYVTHRTHFLSHANRLLADSVRAEEVVHEALLKVMLAAPELSSESHAKAYVHRAIENLCIDIFRLEGRRPSLVVLDDATAEIEKSSAFSSPDLSEVLNRAEDAAIVRQAISLLSPAERAALIMWEVEERSANEIANELGIRESSVRHTISRARSSLRRILSTMVIDEAKGLTGLDLLSRTYGRARGVAKKTSRVALTFILVLSGVAGFNTFSIEGISPSAKSNLPINSLSAVTTDSMVIKESEKNSTFSAVAKPKSLSVKSRSNKPELSFPGLNKSGIPIGFTVADSTGALGPAYFRERAVSSPVSYTNSSQIIKTDSVAANIFIAQTLTSGIEGLSYTPMVSFGKAGEWVPLLVSVSKSEIRALSSGNYLFTAYIAVESAIESSIRITAKASGRDLESAPDQVITRLVLDPERKLVLSQAVYVVESETGA